MGITGGLNLRTTALAILVALLAAGVAEARRVSVEVKRAEVTTVTPENEDLGSYYVLNLDIPDRLGGERFMEAWMDIYVGVDSIAAELYKAGFTTFEVYPLKNELSGEVGPGDLRPSAMKCTIAAGSSERIRVDISEHVRYVLDNPGGDFGLVLGSLSGGRRDKFSLKHGLLGSGVVARAHFVFQKLGGPTATSEP